MSIVYRSKDTNSGREIAIKIIRQDAFPPNQLDRMLKRFQREVITLARLSHPNIVTMLDYGEYQGSPYLVMPYFSGGTLKQQLHGKPMPYQEAARILIPITKALSYAHGLGMVHRDVKTSNILIADSGSPMLADFGISKIITDEILLDITATSAIVGTPEYMAPEQWIGQTSPQSDIYSLGIVFYELITGRKPYSAETPPAVMLKQATEPIPRPGQYVRDLPEVVEKVLLKALARKPEERYLNMAAFARALSSLHEKPRQIGEDKKPKDIGEDQKPQYADEEKIVIECEYCFQKMRIPNRRTKIHVVCPTCRHEFEYSNSVTCPYCGFLNLVQAYYCSNCGKMVRPRSHSLKNNTGRYYLIVGVILIVLSFALGSLSHGQEMVGAALLAGVIGVIVALVGLIIILPPH